MYKFFAFLSRMKFIDRWSLMHSVKKENIMEHSHQAAVLAHALAVIGNAYFGKAYDVNLVAVTALFHESSEVLTGDLPSPIKYFNPEIKTAYKGLEAIACDKLLGMLPDEMRGEYEKVLQPDCSGYEYRLTKCADKLCAYIKCLEELKMSNNEFKKAKQSLEKELSALNSEEVNFFLKNFVEPFKLTLDELD